VADRRAERRSGGVAHGQQRDLVVEVHEALDDHAPGAGAPGGLRVLPRRAGAGGVVNHRLALAARGHHRLDDAWHPERRDRGARLVERVAEAVGGRRQAQLLGSEPADALAIHRQACRTGGRDHAQPVGLQALELGRRDRLDLGDDEQLRARTRTLGVEQGPQPSGVGHVDDLVAVGDMHRGRARVAVDRDHLAAQPRSLERDLAPELAGAEQDDARGARGPGRSDDVPHGGRGR